MLHFEAVIGRVPLSTYFLGVLMTLQITLVCLTHLSEILCSSAISRKSLIYITFCIILKMN